MKKLILIITIFILNACYSQENKTQYEQIYLQNSDTCIGYYITYPYPNPFSPLTHLNFGIPDSSRISMIILDDSGRTIFELKDCQLKSGNYFFDYAPIYSKEKAGKYLMKFSAYMTRRYKDMRFESNLKIIIIK